MRGFKNNSNLSKLIEKMNDKNIKDEVMEDMILEHCKTNELEGSRTLILAALAQFRPTILDNFLQLTA